MRIFAIVSKIEKDYLRLANLISRGIGICFLSFFVCTVGFGLIAFNILFFLIPALDHHFYEIDTKTLSAACVCFLRKMNGISPVWCSQLSVLSNNLISSEYQLSECLNLLENRFR